jgi:hypothetical protein
MKLLLNLKIFADISCLLKLLSQYFTIRPAANFTCKKIYKETGKSESGSQAQAFLGNH